MIDRWLKGMQAGGATRDEVVSMLIKNVGFTKHEAETFLNSRGFKETPVNVDQLTKSRISTEYLSKHTIEANRATARYNVPSDVRDAIGQVSRSMAVFSNANVITPSLPMASINQLNTNNRVFDDAARRLKSVTGLSLPPSTIAYNARAIQSLTQGLQKMRGSKPRFAMGGFSGMNSIRSPRIIGGKIMGKGTYNSDSIPANLLPGSYVLDRDTVQAIGENKLNKLANGGFNALVSNGEYVLSPKQTAAIGVNRLDRLRSLSNDRVLSGSDISKLANGGEFSINNLKRSVTSSDTDKIVEMLTRQDIFDTVKQLNPTIGAKSYNQLFGKTMLTPGSEKIPIGGIRASSEEQLATLTKRKIEEEKLTKTINEENIARKKQIVALNNENIIQKAVSRDQSLRMVRSPANVPLIRITPGQDKTAETYTNKFNATLNRIGSKFSKLSDAAQNIGTEKIVNVRGRTGKVALTETVGADDVERAKIAVQKQMASLTGGVEKQLQDAFEKEFGRYLGRNTARSQVNVIPSIDIGEKGVTGSLSTEFSILSDRLEKAGYDTKKLTGFLDSLSDEIEQTTGSRPAFTMTGGRQPMGAGVSGGLTKAANWSKDFSWRSASISMSSMGVYFSLMGIFMALQGAVTSLTTSLADLNNVFKSVGYVDAFGKSFVKSNDIMKMFKISQKDLVSGWENVTYAQSVFALSMSSLAASMFKDRKFVDGLVGSITSLFSRLSEQRVMDSFIKFIDAGAKVLPEVVDALTLVADALKFVGDQPWLIKLATQLYGITLLIQPLTSGISLFFGAFGQLAEVTSGIIALNKAIAATNSTLLVTSAYLAEVAIAVELISRAYQMVSGQETPWFTKPITAGVNVLTGGDITSGKMFGYAEGGEIKGEKTAEVDDKIVRVEEGEYVINKKSAAKIGKKNLDKLNKYALGGATGSIPMGDAVLNRSIENYNKDAQYLNRINNDLVDKNLQVNSSVDQTLGDSASGTRALHVIVDNMKSAGGNQTNVELPFDIGGFNPANWLNVPQNFSFTGATNLPSTGATVNNNNVTSNNTFNTNINPNVNPNVNANANNITNLTETMNGVIKDASNTILSNITGLLQSFGIGKGTTGGITGQTTLGGFGGGEQTSIVSKIMGAISPGNMKYEPRKPSNFMDWFMKGSYKGQVWTPYETTVGSAELIDLPPALADIERAKQDGRYSYESMGYAAANQIVPGAAMAGGLDILQRAGLKYGTAGGAKGALGTGAKYLGASGTALMRLLGEATAFTIPVESSDALTQFLGGKSAEKIRTGYQAPFYTDIMSGGYFGMMTGKGIQSQASAGYAGSEADIRKAIQEGLDKTNAIPIIGKTIAEYIQKPVAGSYYASLGATTQVGQIGTQMATDFAQDPIKTTTGALDALNNFAISMNPVITGINIVSDIFKTIPEKVVATGTIIDESGNALKTSFTNTGGIIDEQGNVLNVKFDEFGRVIDEKNQVVGVAFDETGQIITGKKDELGTSIDGLTTTITEKQDPLANAFDSITETLKSIPFVGGIFGDNAATTAAQVETNQENNNKTIENLLMALIDAVKKIQPNQINIYGKLDSNTTNEVNAFMRDIQYKNSSTVIR